MRPLALSLHTTYTFSIFQNFEEIDHVHSNPPMAPPLSPCAIGTLRCGHSEGPHFLEMEKMCSLSPAASLRAALCAGGSVFILRAKRYAGGQNGKGGAFGPVRRYHRHLRSCSARLLLVATLPPNTRAFLKWSAEEWCARKHRRKPSALECVRHTNTHTEYIPANIDRLVHAFCRR